jgi:aerobic carbon-monoxide dehydrogenase medium subunit
VDHPASGFAVVGVAARVRKNGNGIAAARIGVTGFGPRAFRARNVEQALEAGSGIPDAVAQIGEGEDANSALYASAASRRQLLRVHAARAIEMALSRAS